jgi:hypothetical protein
MEGQMTGRQVLLAVVAIVLATAVLPPAGARWLNASRITQTRDRAEWAAQRMRTRFSDPRLADVIDADIVCGPGRLPDTVPAALASRPELRQTHESWLAGAVVAPDAFGDGMPTDAWGRCFLMNRARRGGLAWIVSAGPNGLMETPLGAAALGGDDIGAVVR